MIIMGFMLELTSLLLDDDLFIHPDGISIGECLRVSDQSIEYRLVSVKHHNDAANMTNGEI